MKLFLNGNETSFLGIDPDEQLKLNEQDSIILNSSLTLPKLKIETPNKGYVDSLSEKERERQDLSTVFTDQNS